MAFKIKSAKIFFGIKEHTVMFLSVVLSSFFSADQGGR